MFKNKQNKVLFAVLVATLVLSLVVLVPFGVGTVSNIEVIIKFYVCGGLFLVLSVLGLVLKHKNFEPSNKYLTLVSNLPLVSGLASFLFASFCNHHNRSCNLVNPSILIS